MSLVPEKRYVPSTSNGFNISEELRGKIDESMAHEVKKHGVSGAYLDRDRHPDVMRQVLSELVKKL